MTIPLIRIPLMMMTLIAHKRVEQLQRNQRLRMSHLGKSSQVRERGALPVMDLDLAQGLLGAVTLREKRRRDSPQGISLSH